MRPSTKNLQSLSSLGFEPTLSQQEPELESGALDRSAILTLSKKGQHLRFMLFYISHQPALLFGLF